MPPFKDRLSDEAITPVIASFKSLWSDEHRRRHDRHLVPMTAIIRTTLPGFPLDSVEQRFQIMLLFPGYRNHSSRGPGITRPRSPNPPPWPLRRQL
jgi:hypothetical protein